MYTKSSFPRRRESSKTMPSRSGQCQGVASLREDCPIDWIPACAGMTKQRGISLIELIMFIVIISIAVAGILLVMNKVTGHSADTLVRKQALAVAESLLEEITLQAMSGVTPNPGSPTNADRRNFDNVCNYNGYTTTGGIKSMDGNTTLPELISYNVAPAVVVNCTTSPWAGIGIPAGSAVVITVSVTGPGGRIDLTGYRAGN